MGIILLCRSSIIACLAAFLCAISASAQQLDRSAEIARYRQGLDAAETKARIDNLKNISGSGIMDEELFDEIELRLLGRYISRNDEPMYVDETSWQAKALGASGLDKYRATLKKIAMEAPLEKVRRHAAEAEANIEVFAKRNADRSKQFPEAAGLTTEQTLLYSMLRSEDRTLRKDAAKIISRTSPQIPLLFETMAERVRSGYQSVTDEQAEEVDEIAWYCIALAASAQPVHREIIKQVAKGTTSKKLFRVTTGILEKER